ncbi:MAG: histidine kinase [Treponema sp.]
MKRHKVRFSLFFLLVTAFLTVTLIPGLTVFIYFYGLSYNAAQQHLETQCGAEMDKSVQTFVTLINEYRHKAYLLASNTALPSLLQKNHNQRLSDITMYQLLFTAMKGDVSKAAVHIVSVDGTVYYSTHSFPAEYNPRLSNSSDSIFVRIGDSVHSEPVLLPAPRKIQSDTAAFTVIKKIIDRQTLIGYIFIDIFEETFINAYKDTLFSELLLIDSHVYLAYSLLSKERQGNFSSFPFLKHISFPPDTAFYQSDMSMITVRALPNTSFFIGGVMNSAPYFENFHRIRGSFMLIFSLLFIVSLILAVLFSKIIHRPLKSLLNTMQSVQSHTLTYNNSNTCISDFLELSAVYNAMIETIQNLITAAAEKEKQLHTAQQNVLRAQLNPHFLANTLGTVKSLAKLHNEHEIAAIITELHTLLRHTVDNTEAFLSAAETVKLIESWIKIMKLRFGEKFHTEIVLQPECREVFIPSFTIQPFLENAVLHGLEPKIGDWFLSLYIMRDADMLTITISDNGIGCPYTLSPQTYTELKKNGHTGLYTVYTRLNLLYNGRAYIDLTGSPEGTLVRIGIPLD